MPSITGYETDELPQSPGEEIANSVIHGLALLAAIAAVALLFVSTRIFSAAEIVGHRVFAAPMVLLYLTSTLFHFQPQPERRRDHGALHPTGRHRAAGQTHGDPVQLLPLWIRRTKPPTVVGVSSYGRLRTVVVITDS